MSRYRFIVSLSTDEKLERDDVQQYIASAVACWCKSLNPGTAENDYEDRDPLFNVKDVRVHDLQTNLVIFD